MDRETANVPYLLTQYLFRHAEGRKSGARLFGGHFIRCLAAYFGFFSDQGLRGLLVVTRELPLHDLHELGRLDISAEDAPAVDECAQADPAPVSCDGAWWGCEEMLLDQSLIRAGSPPGWYIMVVLSYEQCGIESDSARMRLQHRHLYLHFNVQFRRTSLTGFLAQSVRSSNAYTLDSLYSLVLNTETSQSRQHVSGDEKLEMPEGIVALHHWVYDVLNLSRHYSLILIHLQSYLRTAISNYEVSFGRSLQFWLDLRTWNG
ncbi:hypothetical protein Tco_1456459 [Tanacetum coccineum]